MQMKIVKKNARTGIRTRVGGSTGLHDSPLHYPDAVKSVYLHDVSGTSECDSLHLSLTLDYMYNVMCEWQVVKFKLAG